MQLSEFIKSLNFGSNSKKKTAKNTLKIASELDLSDEIRIYKITELWQEFEKNTYKIAFFHLMIAF